MRYRDYAPSYVHDCDGCQHLGAHVGDLGLVDLYAHTRDYAQCGRDTYVELIRRYGDDGPDYGCVTVNLPLSERDRETLDRLPEYRIAYDRWQESQQKETTVNNEPTMRLYLDESGEITVKRVLVCCADLASDDGENAEYDEGLVDLVTEVTRSGIGMTKRQFLMTVRDWMRSANEVTRGTDLRTTEYGRAIVEATSDILGLTSDQRWIVELAI